MKYFFFNKRYQTDISLTPAFNLLKGFHCIGHPSPRTIVSGTRVKKRRYDFTLLWTYPNYKRSEKNRLSSDDTESGFFFFFFRQNFFGSCDQYIRWEGFYKHERVFNRFLSCSLIGSKSIVQLRNKMVSFLTFII